MYDLIYAGEDLERAQKELLERFPEATLEDASDFIHEGRFAIKIDVPNDEYRLAILDLGMLNISLNFQIFMLQEPKEALSLMKQYQANQKEN